jgi:hypothetical protein
MQAVVPLAHDPELDPYLTLPRTAAVVDQLSYTVAGESPRRASSRLLTRMNRLSGVSKTPFDAQVDAEVSVIKSRSDWKEGLFCSLTRFQGTTRERLLDNHARWIQWVEKVTKRQVSQYRVVDYTMVYNPHIHALMYGVSSSSVSPVEMEDAWNSINRIPKRARRYAPDVQPIEGPGALYYCARRAVRYGERDILGPWPIMSPVIEVDESPEEVINRELGDILDPQVRRIGRPRREILYAQSWLLLALKQGSRDVADLRRLAWGQDFSWETVLRAKRLLNVIPAKVGSRWTWSL